MDVMMSIGSAAAVASITYIYHKDDGRCHNFWRVGEGDTRGKEGRDISIAVLAARTELHGSDVCWHEYRIEGNRKQTTSLPRTEFSWCNVGDTSEF
jgi:hypothetical protein